MTLNHFINSICFKTNEFEQNILFYFEFKGIKYLNKVQKQKPKATNEK